MLLCSPCLLVDARVHEIEGFMMNAFTFFVTEGGKEGEGEQGRDHETLNRGLRGPVLKVSHELVFVGVEGLSGCVVGLGHLGRRV